jgi:predicted esterase
MFRFDCYSFDIPNRPEDEAGLYRSAGQINDIISAEVKNHNIPSNRIIIGGLSQGSAVSVLTALTSTRPLAGVFVLSGYIPLRKKVKEACPILYQFPTLCHLIVS